MAASKGFTLIEIIIILTIIGISAMIAIPYLVVSAEQTKAQVAKNNLYAIAAAQQKYYEDYGSYCTATTGNTVPCADNTADLNTNLRVSISDSFNYSCSATLENIPYNCIATDTYIINLTLDPNNQSPTPIVICTSNGVANGPGCPY